MRRLLCLLSFLGLALAVTVSPRPAVGETCKLMPDKVWCPLSVGLTGTVHCLVAQQDDCTQSIAAESDYFSCMSVVLWPESGCVDDYILVTVSPLPVTKLCYTETKCKYDIQLKSCSSDVVTKHNYQVKTGWVCDTKGGAG